MPSEWHPRTQERTGFCVRTTPVWHTISPSLMQPFLWPFKESMAHCDTLKCTSSQI